jgi:hypothetical protein
VPVPGGEMTGYLRIRPHPQGAHVEVHQIVNTPAEAEYMERAWAMVLGRLQAGVVRAVDSDEPMPPRAARPKRRDLAPRRADQVAGGFGVARVGRSVHQQREC